MDIVTCVGGVDMDIVTCGECLWWRCGADSDEGRCHRYAPRATTARSVVVWPMTTRDDDCGEAEERPNTDPIGIY